MSAGSRQRSIDASPEELRKHLRAYLLSSDNSWTAFAIEQIIDAYTTGRSVELGGFISPLRLKFENILKLLHIDYILSITFPQLANAHNTRKWVNEGQPKRPRIWVPTYEQRLFDFNVIVPHALKKAVADMKVLGVDVEPPRVTALYLIYLRSCYVKRCTIWSTKTCYDQVIEQSCHQGSY